MSYLGSSSTLFDPTRNSPVNAQVLTGNGSQTVFTLNYAVNQTTDISVYIDNVVQQPDYAYGVSGNQITFSAPPPAPVAALPNNIYIVFNKTAGLTGTVPDGSISGSKLATNIRLLATDQYTGNGVAYQFALSDTPADANALIVTVNGVTQSAPVNYTTSGNILTFTSAPNAGANVVIRNVGFRTTQTAYALPSGTPIVQPKITGGTVNLASSISTTGNVSVYDNTGVNLKAQIGPNYVLTSNPFFLNSNTVSANVTIPSGYNAFAVGPLTQSGNVSITVATGSKYVIF